MSDEEAFHAAIKTMDNWNSLTRDEQHFARNLQISDSYCNEHFRQAAAAGAVALLVSFCKIANWG